MWGKHFASTYTGSMLGAGAEVFAVWGFVIANTVDSQVELNPRLIASLLGSTETAVEDAIGFLCQPDPRSRSQAEDGRRLIQEGQFAYRVVNYETYHKVRDERDRREYNRTKKAEGRARNVNTRVNVSIRESNMSAQEEEEAEAEAEADKEHRTTTTTTSSLREGLELMETAGIPKGLPKPRPRVKPKPDKPKTPSWVVTATQLYETEIGILPFARIGKALKPVVDKHGWEETQKWWRSYCKWRPYQKRDGSIFGDSPKDNPGNVPPKDTRFCSPEEFVRTLTTWQAQTMPYHAHD